MRFRCVCENGQVWIADRSIGLPAKGEPDGPAELYFRPHDIELLDGCGGCIAGLVSLGRRVAGTRHVELDVPGATKRVEIEVPADSQASVGTRIAFRPRVGSCFAPDHDPDRIKCASVDGKSNLTVNA